MNVIDMKFQNLESNKLLKLIFYQLFLEAVQSLPKIYDESHIDDEHTVL